MRHRAVGVGRTLVLVLAAVAVAGAVGAPAGLAPIGSQGATREFTVHAHRYAFDPDRIEVQQDDLVKITFHADDIPHSFTLDAYRISKRAAPGAPVVFEFRADQAGRFPYYCRLTNDEGCRDMRGELVVHRR